MGKRAFKQLTERDRVLISRLKTSQYSISEIARRIGKDKSTISRELRRNADLVTAKDRLFWFKIQNYLTDDELEDHIKTLPLDSLKDVRHWSARDAQQRRNYRVWLANQKRRRKSAETRRWVIAKIRQGWSPDQIAGRSKIEAPEQVSHEYVYQLVYRDKKRGGKLYRLLKRFGRRKQRFNSREYNPRQGAPNRVGIEERPAIVEQRRRLGDLEADLIVGYRSSGYVLSVVDRKSKLTILRKLKTKRKTTVQKQIAHAIDRLGRVFTLTLDNGKEFYDHGKLPVRVYFAHPYCSSERGTVENTNGLIRHYLPKKTSFRKLTQTQLTAIQDLLNNRPRKCLRYLTPKEVHFKKRSKPRMSERCI